MVRGCLAYAVIAASSAAAAMLSPALADPRAVIELFTSQGCSSCPAADKLLGELATDSSLIAITLPIDYWDYLGWKDTLADPRNTARQNAYMKSRGDRERYTPQAVVNGAAHALGSSREAIEKAIAKSRQHQPATLSVPVKLASDGRQIAVTVQAGGAAGAGTVIWIAGLAEAVTVAITRGENKGKTVTYHNVVRSWIMFDTWDGNASHWLVPHDRLKRAGVDRAAIFIQSGTAERPGAMLGAAIASLR